MATSFQPFSRSTGLRIRMMDGGMVSAKGASCIGIAFRCLDLDGMESQTLRPSSRKTHSWEDPLIQILPAPNTASFRIQQLRILDMLDNSALCEESRLP